MEKNQYNLCIDILNVLQTSGALKHVVLIGSWAMKFYANYFKSESYMPVIQTRDIDFLVPIPVKVSDNVDIQKLFEDLGFIRSFYGDKGYIKFEHPDLIVEFLVPERGRGINRPYDIPELGINATALRYLDFLEENTITVTIEGIRVKVPHPAAYALHKCIVFERRKKKDKKEKDFEGALRVLNELIKNKKRADIRKVFQTMHKKWQKTVMDNLSRAGEDEIAEYLRGLIER